MTLALLLSACASDAKSGSQDTTPVEEDTFNQHDSQESTQQEVLDVDNEDKGSMDTQTTSHLPQTTSNLPQTTSHLPFTEMTNSSPAENGNSTDVTGEQVPNSDPTKRSITKIHNPLFPITDSSYSAYGILFLAFVVFAFGVVGNLAVMCIVWQNYFMRSAWNYFLASLAFWDFLVLCFCLPVVVFNELTNKRLLGDFSCRVVPYIEVRPF